MSDSVQSPQRRNHNLATLALVLAFAGIMIIQVGVLLAGAALVVAWIARGKILANPKRYTGMMLVFGAAGISVAVLLLHLAFWLMNLG